MPHSQSSSRAGIRIISLISWPVALVLIALTLIFTFGLTRTEAQETAQEQPLSGNIYFFWGEGCPHCAKEKPFLESLERKYAGVKVYDFEVWNSAENREIMIETGNALEANVSGVPFTVIGNQYVIGYFNDETTGKQIESMLIDCLECRDIVSGILATRQRPESAVPPSQTASITPSEQTPAPAESSPTEPTPTASPAESTPTEPEPAVSASTETVDLHFFYTSACPKCTEEKKFLQFLASEDESLKINYYDIGKEKPSRELYRNALKEFNLDAATLPFITIGKQYIMGWDSFETTGQSVREAIKCVKENHCEDKLKHLLVSAVSSSEYRPGQSPIPETLTLPLIGEVKTKNISLPALTLIIAALDGFNPCAMWTLIFLIGLLLGMQDRRRMWALGGTFIVASALMYFLFLAAWLNILLFLGFVFWVRVAIGLVALGGGIYYLKEFFTAEDTTCKVTGSEKRKKTFEKIKKITHEGNFWLALTGIVILAFAVNLVELICSAGLPAVYTQILTLSDLETWQYYLYLVLYIFIFMLDDLIVFFIAMITLQVSGLSGKYSRASHIIGGTIMVIIGILLWFKPELLMFG